MRHRLTLSLVWLLVFVGTAASAQEPAEAAAAAEVGVKAALAEGDTWPIGLRLSDEMVGERSAKRQQRPADVLIWLPPQAPTVRAMILVPDNTDSKHFLEHEPLREVAAKHRVALIYLRHFWTGIEYHHKQPVETPPAAPDNILKLLDLIAEQTGHAELRHTPWITFGKSSRGEFPFRMGWVYPQRTIAGITYHGESPTWPIPAYAAEQDQSILYVSANGQEEWSGTWYRHHRPFLMNYRQHTAWLPHQVVGRGVGHGNYVDAHGSDGWAKPVPADTMSVLRIWDYLALFVDKALTLRLPQTGDQTGDANGDPTDAPLKLRQIDPATGYLIHPRAIEELLGIPWMAFRKNDAGIHTQIPWPDEEHPVHDPQPGRIEPADLIRKAAEVPEDERAGYLWIADKELVHAWLKLHNVHNRDVPVP